MAEQPPRRRKTVLLRDDRPKALAFLVVSAGEGAGDILRLNAGVTRIGRDGLENDHVLPDAYVSQRHLSIRLRNGAFWLTDLDTPNGTRVNGQPVDRCRLANGDVVVIGKTELTFVRVGGKAPTTTGQA